MDATKKKLHHHINIILLFIWVGDDIYCLTHAVLKYRVYLAVFSQCLDLGKHTSCIFAKTLNKLCIKSYFDYETYLYQGQQFKSTPNIGYIY